MQKSATFDLMPSPAEAMTVAKEYGPKAVAYGGGLAALKYILSQVHDQKKVQEDADKREQSHGLVVSIPQKTASPMEMVNPEDANATVAAATDAVKKLPPPYEKQQATSATPTPSIPWHDSMVLATLMGGGYLGYKGLSSILDAHRKAEKHRQLEAARQQYSSLLSDTLSGVKQASLPEFPAFEGMIQGLTQSVTGQRKIADPEQLSQLALVGGIPLSIALLSAIAGHSYVYNKEKQFDESFRQKKISPPKSIRIVTEQPEAAGPGEKEEQDDALKVASTIPSIMEIAAGDMIANRASGIGGSSDSVPARDTAEAASVQPETQTIGKDIMKVDTSGGPVVVTAADQNAVAFLHKKRKELANILAAIPVES